MMALSAAGSSTTLSVQFHPAEFIHSRTTQLNLPPTHLKRTRPKPPYLRGQILCMSLNIPKEGKPISQNPESPPAAPDESTPESGEGDEGIKEAARRRLEEKFAVLNTGIHECRSCGYKFDEKLGDPSYPVPPGLAFEELPENWRCPTCGAAKSFFQSKSIEIAGFAQNQQFGLGGNSLTSGQKAVLIYGSLLFFFALFLSGFFIQ